MVPTLCESAALSSCRASHNAHYLHRLRLAHGSPGSCPRPRFHGSWAMSTRRMTGCRAEHAVLFGRETCIWTQRQRALIGRRADAVTYVDCDKDKSRCQGVVAVPGLAHLCRGAHRPWVPAPAAAAGAGARGRRHAGAPVPAQRQRAAGGRGLRVSIPVERGSDADAMPGRMHPAGYQWH